MHGRTRDPAGSEETFFGPHRAIYRAALVPPAAAAQWTGIATRIAGRLLKTGSVAAVLAVEPDPDDRRCPRSVLVTDPADMARCRGMRIGYAPLLALLEPAIEAGHRGLAVIGVPCQIHPLRALKQELDLERLFVIGIPYSDNTTTENFHRFLALLPGPGSAARSRIAIHGPCVMRPYEDTPMAADTHALDAVVIGAGSAGMGMSYHLTRVGLRHLVVERARIGETWRTQRWDSFRLNTPKVLTVLPGDRYEGPDPESFMTCDEFVAMLEDYARRNRLPIETGRPVSELVGAGNIYRLETPEGALHARNVVIACGHLTCPRRPPFAGALPSGLLQIDACSYRNADALPPGAVLVVGSAQSGGQIAEDLTVADRTVFLATGRVGRMPRRYRGRDFGLWMKQTGLFDVPRKDFVDSSGRVASRPLLGAVHTISLQSLSALGVVLLGRLLGAEQGGTRLTVADDLQDNLLLGDESSARYRRHVDDFIARHGLDVPVAEEDPAETVAPRLPDPPVLSLDLAGSGIGTVIWCTGFAGDYGWIRLPGVLDVRGQPAQEEGISVCPGIYFAGLDFVSTRKSGTVHAIDEEARRFVEHIAARC